MGLTKQYLRYVPGGNFNLIASRNCNISFVTLDGQEGRFVAVGACEHVIIWDLRLGEKAQVLTGEKATVTSLCASPNKRHLAAGYSDGTIQVFDLKSGEAVCIFSGHDSEVTALAYDKVGSILATASKDTDIVVWDVIAETGICRLFGHRGPVTHLQFMAEQSVLISGSRDTFIKFWDLQTQRCFKTLVGNHNEIWALALLKDDNYLVVASGSKELGVWKISYADENQAPVESLNVALENVTLNEDDDPTHPLQCRKAGTLMREGKSKVTAICTDESGQIVACHGSDHQVEFFQFCSDEDVQVRFKRRLSRARKKSKAKQEENMEVDDENESECVQLSLQDEVKRLNPVKLSAKPKSVHIALGIGGELRIAVGLTNNSLELYSISIKDKKEEPKCLRWIKRQGHRGEIRAVCFSSDNSVIVSGSAESVKVWNVLTQTCVTTIETGYVLSVVFVPGDHYVLAGLKDGRLLIIDISVGDILEEVSAHAGELWSICLQTTLLGCITGGGDMAVKFWQFEMIVDEKSESKAKVLSVVHTRTLKLEETVLCVRISPNGKFLAVALLDSGVKIFFVDTFKYHLTLRGHKHSVLTLDISSDSTLIATGSADCRVKIWGMDFGDCHRTLVAHDSTVMSLQFVPETHHFFTCGKDGRLRQWDGDSFDKIVTLQGHAGEAWALAVSPNGKHVVSCGSDRVLRLYEKTDQILVLEDEEEEEREKQEELVTGEVTSVPGKPGLILCSKKTVGSERGAESILECLEICEQYKEQLAEHVATQSKVIPPPHPLMQALNVSTIDDFLVETLARIRSSDLEQSLILLPFTSVCQILHMMPPLFKKESRLELLCKVYTFLLKIHHRPIVETHSLVPTLMQLNELAMSKVKALKDLIGFNLYGLMYLQRKVEETEGVQIFRDATIQKKKGEKKRRQREKLKRAIVDIA